MVSCRFSLQPIHWIYHRYLSPAVGAVSGTGPASGRDTAVAAATGVLVPGQLADGALGFWGILNDTVILLMDVNGWLIITFMGFIYVFMVTWNAYSLSGFKFIHL